MNMIFIEGVKLIYNNFLLKGEENKKMDKKLQKKSHLKPIDKSANILPEKKINLNKPAPKKEQAISLKIKDKKQKQNSIEKLQRNNSVNLKQKSKLQQIKLNDKKRPKSSEIKLDNKKKLPGIVKNEELKKPQKNLEIPKEKIKIPIKEQPSKSLITSHIFQQKDMGLTFMKPEFDRIIYQNLDITDSIYDKYLDMISNDNDSFYVLNSIPQIKQYRKQQEAEKKKILQSVLTGRLSKISGLFDHLTVDKVISALKNKPQFYENKSKIHNCKLILETKFKVSVDIGFLQYTVQGDKLIILRIYISRIYRKMNYTGYIYLDIMKQLIEKNTTAIDRCAILIHEKNTIILKFHKYLGFKIERVLTDSKNQKVDYFQEFVIKKKQFFTIYQKIISP